MDALCLLCCQGAHFEFCLVLLARNYAKVWFDGRFVQVILDCLQVGPFLLSDQVSQIFLAFLAGLPVSTFELGLYLGESIPVFCCCLVELIPFKIVFFFD